jgi:HEAT repeat protein
MRRFLGRHLDGALLSLFLLIVVGALVPMLPSRPAKAGDAKVDALKAYALSDVDPDLRRAALNDLQKLGSSDAADALEAVAREGDLEVRIAACAQLGRMKTSASKGKLKALLEDTDLKTEVRMAAVACIAEHWKDSGDIDYLEGKCAAKDDLKTFCATVKTKVFTSK